MESTDLLNRTNLQRVRQALHGHGSSESFSHVSSGVDGDRKCVPQCHGREQHLDADQEVLISGGYRTCKKINFLNWQFRAPLPLYLTRDTLKLVSDRVFNFRLVQGILKGGSITVLLTSCLTGLESAVTTDNVWFYLQNRLILTSETGGRWYSEIPPFGIPRLVCFCYTLATATFRAVNLA